MANSARKFTWNKGDLDIRKEGDGPELISETDLAEIEAESKDEFGRPDPGFRAPREK